MHNNSCYELWKGDLRQDPTVGTLSNEPQILKRKESVRLFYRFDIQKNFATSLWYRRNNEEDIQNQKVLELENLDNRKRLLEQLKVHIDFIGI